MMELLFGDVSKKVTQFTVRGKLPWLVERLINGWTNMDKVAKVNNSIMTS